MCSYFHTNICIYTCNAIPYIKSSKKKRNCSKQAPKSLEESLENLEEGVVFF